MRMLLVDELVIQDMVLSRALGMQLASGVEARNSSGCFRLDDLF